MSDNGLSQVDLTGETVSLLRVFGEVDLATAPDLRARLADATADPSVVLVVDLSGVTFLSCSGLLPLVEAQAHLGPRLWMRRPSRPVRRLLDVTGQWATFSLLEDATDPDLPSPARFASMSAPLPSAGRSTPPVAVMGSLATTPATRTWDDGSKVVPTMAAFDLQAQVVGLQGQLRRGVLIEQAKGLLMGIHRCDAATSLRLLVTASHDHAVSVDDLAQALATAAAGRADCSSSHVALAAVRALMARGQQSAHDGRRDHVVPPGLDHPQRDRSSDVEENSAS